MKKIFILLIVCGCLQINAQQKENEKLSGMLFADSKIIIDNSVLLQIPNPNLAMENKKSPLLAAALSFVVPGAGEFYSESYLKSAVFLALEAAAITVGLIYDKKGDDQTTFFENYANEHWSVQRYAKWTVTNATTINSGIDPSSYNVFNSSGSVNWKELNRLESDLGSYYSHRLAYYGEQQYFEMIGKYHQFNPGWDDFGDENTPYVYNSDENSLTENFRYYADERGKANDFYNVASKAVIVIVANHFISAIDAAWSAARFNKNLELSAELKKLELGYYVEYYPQLNIKYGL
jgi:hypothetical protein